MVGKINSGSTPVGCATYCLDHDDAKILRWEGLDIYAKEAELLAESSGQLRKDLARQMAYHIDTCFGIQADMNPKVEKPVGHISLSFMKEDAPMLDDEKMADIAVEYLDKMGYLDTQFMVVRHYKEDGNPHVHLFFNIVDNNGRRLNTYLDFKRNAAICKELTVKYGFHMSPGRENTNVEKLHGVERTRYQISNAIDQALPSCKNWNDLGRALLLQGITMDLVKRNDGSIQGVRFGKRSDENGKWMEFRGSKVGKKYSFGNLNKALNQLKNDLKDESKSNSNSNSDASKQSKSQGQSAVASVVQTAVSALMDMACDQGGGKPDHVPFEDLPDEEKERIISQLKM